MSIFLSVGAVPELEDWNRYSRTLWRVLVILVLNRLMERDGDCCEFEATPGYIVKHSLKQTNKYTSKKGSFVWENLLKRQNTSQVLAFRRWPSLLSSGPASSVLVLIRLWPCAVLLLITWNHLIVPSNMYRFGHIPKMTQKAQGKSWQKDNWWIKRLGYSGWSWEILPLSLSSAASSFPDSNVGSHLSASS